MKTTPLVASVRAAYNAFLSTREGVQLYERFKQILYGEKDPLALAIADVLFGCLAPAPGKGNIRVCDLGGGDGRRISRIISALHKQSGMSFDLDLVDQSPEMIAAFDPARLPEVATWHLFCGRFEDVPLHPPYEVVSLIHSIFAIQAPETLQRILELVDREGSIVIVSNASDSFLAGLKQIVDQGFTDERFEITDLKLVLQKRNVTFRETTHETRWTIRHEDLEQDVATIIDWLALGQIQRLSAAQHTQIREYVRVRSVPNESGWSLMEKEIIVGIGPKCR